MWEKILSFFDHPAMMGFLILLLMYCVTYIDCERIRKTFKNRPKQEYKYGKCMSCHLIQFVNDLENDRCSVCRNRLLSIKDSIGKHEPSFHSPRVENRQ